ncbi:MAG: DNA gyrase subunit A [Ruminococcaceae bacterium]|nr:DNA gyrase subunit A [Oscillospiraceae bacterium]
MAIEHDYSKYDNQVILNLGIENEVKTAYIDYAMSVIIGRALPDVRDGLKPVHRRILYSMYEDKLTYDKPFRKSATTVGNVLGRYHPHGDASVYDALVRLVQKFSLRYPLVEGHGNFGNIDGDGAAAYRYTEARMAKIANLMLEDIEKDVVDFMPNFDNKLKEPEYLPSRFPNLLVNGSIGIAVGMATNIPPHNMGEVIDAVIYLMDNPECTIGDLMEYVKGPDFPTYGTIHGTSGIKQAYLTGRGRLKVRAVAHFEENKNRTSIIITELPYQVNRTLLLQNMAELVKTKRVEGISDIRNESGKDGMRIVVDVKRDANAQVVLNMLYKYTQLEDTFAINMLALVNGEPKTLNLKEILVHYLNHQSDVITRRTKFELKKAERLAHIYEGYKIAIDHIDRIIEIIRGSKNVSEAKENLIAEKFPKTGDDSLVRLTGESVEFMGEGYFTLTDEQAQAIVEMTLGRLSGMERRKIEETLASLYAQIDGLNEILSDEGKLYGIIREDLLEIKAKYGDERRTKIEESENDILIEDLIDRVRCVITATNQGYIKRIPSEEYQSQRRGGKGIKGMTTKEEDVVEDVIIANSHDFLLMFSDSGKVYIKKCYEIPESGRTSKGTNLVNVLNLSEGERITAIIPVSEFKEEQNLVMVTQNAVIKRTSLMDFRRRRTSGLFAINLDEGDKLLYVLKTAGDEEVILASHKGMAVRFKETDVRKMGRQARGVKAMNLVGDFVVGAAVIPNDYEEKGLSVLTISENGFGKRSPIDEFSVHKRGGKGVTCHKVTTKTGPVAGIAITSEDDEIMLITDGGIIIRTTVDQIPVHGRATGGVIVMRMNEGSKIARFALLSEEETEENDGSALAEIEALDDFDSDNQEEASEVDSEQIFDEAVEEIEEISEATEEE